MIPSTSTTYLVSSTPTNTNIDAATDCEQDFKMLMMPTWLPRKKPLAISPCCVMAQDQSPSLVIPPLVGSSFPSSDGAATDARPANSGSNNVQISARLRPFPSSMEEADDEEEQHSWYGSCCSCNDSASNLAPERTRRITISLEDHTGTIPDVLLIPNF
mmetsp:Transcript_26627/g.47318  ORF Transcript_26627/g.47318 Transcript_26627/m.47318 type:complete len:159 (+) Transcript_26627:116-592(+)|eukprot:CAMPEP_0178804402 /NCGR_PEP_ID=MMETSP0745-20121128/15059_1 /TAXON_ID=913974 /ORGANISM="Nitzschia punctata, Strain CCMP561" /LENGTH=158 /DNA_ID=CAMNT_0020463697 /DNA_START=60 /DNA_END=536 /DNA_ORIENTATION=+